MARWAYILVAFAVLAAWAGAQNPAQPALSPEDKLRLHKTNSALIDNLVRDGIALSAAGDSVQRAERCRDAARSLANAIGEAANAENAERVAELTTLFREVVRDGLLPTLDEAQRSVPADSPGGRKLRDLRKRVADDVSELETAIPSGGKLNGNTRVQDALKQLDELGQALK